MIFDGICLRKIVAELHTCLIDGKVNKVFAPTKNEILLSIYSHGTQYALLASIASDNYHLNLTTTSKPNPLKASNFCMLLRKHLIGFRITKIEMRGLERIVFIHLAGYNEMNDPTQKIVVIELMGKHSNILLLTEKGTIIDSLRHLDIDSGATRDLLPAHPYEMPENTKVDFEQFATEQDFLAYCKPLSAQNLSQLLANHLIGISKNYVEIFLETQNRTNEVSEENLSAFYQSFRNDLAEIHKTQESTTPIRTWNFACDDFYSQKEEKRTLQHISSKPCPSCFRRFEKSA